MLLLPDFFLTSNRTTFEFDSSLNLSINIKCFKYSINQSILFSILLESNEVYIEKC